MTAADKTAKITVGSTSFECQVVTGTENESALDIASLRAKTGLVALDPAFMNTAAVKSQITFLDGEKGVLRYRGIPIEQLAERSTFVETSYLLVYGNLPTKPELEKFSTMLTRRILARSVTGIYHDAAAHARDHNIG